MLALPVFTTFIFTVAAAIQPAELTGSADVSCTSTQTQCALGCCPYVNATCCADGFECCQEGQTCIPYIGICLNVVDGGEKGVSLASSQSTPVEQIVTACPSGTTTCGPDRCCRYPAATCCSDGLHCCPHGYRCDLPNKRCVRNSINSIFDDLTSMPAVKVVKKLSYKSCPGNNKICPSYRSCCKTDNGQWDCCPSPSQNSFGLVGGECCDTLFGRRMCCPEICTIFGCAHG